MRKVALLTVAVVIIAMAIVEGSRIFVANNKTVESPAVSSTIEATNINVPTEIAKKEETAFAVASPAAAPGTAKNQPSEPPAARFRKLEEQVVQAIPPKAELAKLPEEEVHSTPKPIMDAAVELGKMAEALERDPSLEPQGIEFYKRCAFQHEYPTSVRALCFHNAEKLIAKRGETWAEANAVPENVRRLAAKLQ